MDFVEWVQHQLDLRLWSRYALAKKSGLSHSMISRVMGGKVTAGVKFRVGIARAFNMQLEELPNDDGSYPTRRDRSQPRKVKEVATMMAEMDDEQQELVKIYAAMVYATRKKGKKKQEG